MEQQPIPTPSPAPSPTNRSEPREVFVMVILGRKGTGKTTYIRRLINKSLQNKRRVLVVTPNFDDFQGIPMVHPDYPQRVATYKGARKIICRADPKAIDEICKNFRHGLLVFDDCRAYIDDKPSIYLKSLLISARHDDVDIIAVGHGFTTVPPQFFAYATHFMIFATTDNPINRKKNVRDYPTVEATVNKVNHDALTDPHTFKIVKNE
ncbi:MAG: hypothetical protein K6A94_12085 [Bacteroidales bacterium]|nr:hypothetical protein [Bacteroidales bacterium]